MKKIDPWLAAQAHETAIHSIVTELGGVDYEGIPTSRLNYLQRIRILKEKERRLDDAVEDAKAWKYEALKWKAQASSLSIHDSKICNAQMVELQTELIEVTEDRDTMREALCELWDGCSLTEKSYKIVEDALKHPLTKPKAKIRPDSEGWWWRLCKGELEIGKAEYIAWEDAGEPEQERVLAWSRGGCYTRCDYINLRSDSGTRWIKATPPALDSENAIGHAPGAHGKATEPKLKS